MVSTKQQKLKKTFEAKSDKMGSFEMIYYDPRQPGSYAGKKAFQRVIGSPVEDWLLSQEAYTLHKSIRRNFQRRRVVVGGIDEQWQADLVDLISLKKENKNFQYLLTVVDVFSKFAWVEPLKQKPENVW